MHRRPSVFRSAGLFTCRMGDQTERTSFIGYRPQAAGPPGPNWRILLVALFGVVVVQVLVIAIGDSRFTSSTDSGGRAAAIAAASANGGCDHDLGYWAADVDPQGRHHPLVNTARRGTEFVQPASLAYVCPSAVLERSFGRSAFYVVPVLGVALAALGAWLLERAMGGAGWLSLALVGVAGPVAFYGGDSWEHAPATGLVLIGTALALGRRFPTGVLGGVCWGLAVTLRTETALVALTLGATFLLLPTLRDRYVRAHPCRTLLVGASAAAVVLGDRILERATLGSDVRGSRTVGASSQIGSNLEQRVRDVLVTSIAPLSNENSVLVFLIGAGFVIATVVLALHSWDRVSDRRLLLTGTAVVVLVVLNQVLDPGWIPGSLVAAPLASVGVLGVTRLAGPVARGLAIAAVAALPLIWLTQWTGAHTGQWGGRYQLPAVALLTVVGSSLLSGRLVRSGALVVIAASVVIGGVGLRWHVHHTTVMGQAWDDLAEVECDGVLVSASIFFLREAGATDAVQSQRLGSCALLSAVPAGVPDALAVAERSGAASALVVYRFPQRPNARQFVPWVVRSREVTMIGPLEVTLVRLELPTVAPEHQRMSGPVRDEQERTFAPSPLWPR